MGAPQASTSPRSKVETPPVSGSWAWDSEHAAYVESETWRCGWRPRGDGVVTTASGLLIPAPAVLLQFLPSSRVPSVRVFRAEVGTEAVGGGSQGRLCTALKGWPVGVQILLCKVGVHFCKPAEVGWKDKGTCGYWDLGGRYLELMALPWDRMGGPHPLWQAWTEGNDLGGEKRNEHPTPFFSAAPKITETQGGGDCILLTIPLWEFKGSVIVSSVVRSGNSARVSVGSGTGRGTTW